MYSTHVIGISEWRVFFISLITLLVTVMSTVITFREQDVLEVAMLQGIQIAFITAALLSICGLVLSFFIVQE